jgi:hypothetical protein
MPTHKDSTFIWLACVLGVIALLGWSADAAHLLAPSHDLAAAMSLGLGGLSAVFLMGFLATSADVGRQRVRQGSADEHSHIHVPRPERDYFSPYAPCQPMCTKRGGDHDDSRTP